MNALNLPYLIFFNRIFLVKWKINNNPIISVKKPGKIIKKAAKFGADAAIKGIDSLEQKAINKGLPASAVHNVSNLVRDRTQAAAKKFTTTATHKVNTGINNIVRDRLPPSLTPSHKKTVASRKRKNTSHRRQGVHSNRKKRKPNTKKSLSSLIEEY